MTETSSARVLPNRMLSIGMPCTFVIVGCPVVLTRWDRWFEIRPQGELHDGNAADVLHILEVVLDSRRPVTLLLADVRVVDDVGAQMLDHALAAAKAVGVEWTVLELPAVRPIPDSSRGVPVVYPPDAVPSLLRRSSRLVGLAFRPAQGGRTAATSRC